MYDIIIIGGGPAGLSAAIYAGRGGMRTLILEKSAAGGQVNYTYEIDNYPGICDNPTGSELAEKMRTHAEKFGAEIKTETVREIIDPEGDIKRVVTRRNVYETRTVIFATGAVPKKLGADGEDRLYGMGVSYCAVCDGAFFKGQETAVIGGGNTALEDALYLAGFCTRVYLIHRREGFRANASLVKKAQSNPRIVFLTNRTVERICGDTGVKALVLKDTVTGSSSELEVSGVFIAVGTAPETELAKKYVKTDENGFIVTDRYMQTSVKGIYAAGDARETPLRQVITAAADGAVAATQAVNRCLEL